MFMKKNLLILIFAIFLGLTLNSCDRISENYRKEKEIENYTSPYKGLWTGSYSGDENGTLKIEVFKAGNLEIVRTLNNSQYSETFYGSITDYGAFNSTKSQSSGFTILGNLLSQNNTDPTGTWNKNNEAGIWQLKKQ